MLSTALRPNRWPLGLLTIALIVGGCGVGAGTAVPASGATVRATGSDQVLGAAAAAMARVDSYKFAMTLAGGKFDSMLGMLGDPAPSANTPFSIRGTITNAPEAAADVAITGMHLVEIAGYDYVDMGLKGAFDRIPITDTRLADQFSPVTMLPILVNASAAGGFNKVGVETRNGVSTDHYQASEPALARLGAVAAINGATWTADVWIASVGGYPVSMAVVGRGGDSVVVYEVLFDITDVNAAANRVVAPANVTGS